MNPSASLDDFSQRPMRNWSQDGLPDLMLGLMMVVLGVVFLIGVELPKGSSVRQVYSMAAPWLGFGCAIALLRLIKKLKERITFPRTGYVALPEATWKYRAVIGATVFLAGAGLTFVSQNWSGASGPVVALVMAAALMVGGYQYWRPYILLAIWSLLLGLFTYGIGTGMEGGLWVLVGVGVTMAVSGAWRLRGFLRANPLPGEGAE